MKKQEYFDMGIQVGLNPGQIEEVLCSVMGISKDELFTKKEISAQHIYAVQQAFYALQSGVSQEYMLEKANFYGRDFFVDERVLIPRNDTELLVDVILQELQKDIGVKNMVYIDVGTGSSCVAVSVVEEIHPLKFEKALALELSQDAIDVAVENIEKLAPGKIEILESNLLSGVFHDDSLNGKRLCISANLPYIKDGDHNNMDESVVRNEPNRALYGGSNTGFELYEALIKQCFQMKQVHNIEEIHLFIEIGFDQKKHSEKFLQDLGLRFEYFTDNSNIERVIYIKDF